MVTLKCQDCGKDYEGTKKDIEDSSCDCGGSYQTKGSEDDNFSITCGECDEEYTEPDDIIQFENAGGICKKCIDQRYSVKEKIVEKIVEKFIEVPKETIKVMGFSEPIL